MTKKKIKVPNPEMEVGGSPEITLQQQVINMAKQYGPIPAFIVAALWAGSSFFLEPSLRVYVDEEVEAVTAKHFADIERRADSFRQELINIESLMLEKYRISEDTVTRQKETLDMLREFHDASQEN